MNMCCTITVYHISKQSLIGLFIEDGEKLILWIVINLSVYWIHRSIIDWGIKTVIFFSLLWTQTHNSASADDEQMNLCVGVFFQSLDIKEHYDNKSWIELSLSMSVCKETLFFFHFVSRLFHVFHPSVAKELWHAAFISTLLHYHTFFLTPVRTNVIEHTLFRET